VRLLIAVALALVAGACEKSSKDVKRDQPVVVEKTVPAAAPKKADGLPLPCDDYKTMIERLARCDKLPLQSREALKQGFEAMKSAWTNVGDLPPAAFKAMSEACAQGADALRQAAQAMCPPDTFKVEREQP